MLLHRNLSITDQAAQFLERYQRLLARDGCPHWYTEAVAGDLLEALIKISRGALKCAPTYVGVDPDFPGYSRYTFSQGAVFGIYSSCGDAVILVAIDAQRISPATARAIAAA